MKGERVLGDGEEVLGKMGKGRAGIRVKGSESLVEKERSPQGCGKGAGLVNRF